IPIKRVVAGNFSQDDFALFRGGKKVPFMLLNDILLFSAEEMQPYTEYEYSLYLKRDRKNQIVKTGGTKQSSYIMSDQKADTHFAVDFKAFERMLNSPSNMAKNPSFEEDINGWYKRYTTKDEAKVVDGGIYGKKALSVKIDKSKDWFGVHQDIKNIQYGKSYICAIAVKAIKGDMMLPRFRLTSSKNRESNYFTKKLSSSGDWQIQDVIFNNDLKNSYLSVGLIGTEDSEFLVDGVLFAECYRCEKYKAQTAFDLQAEKKIISWQVNSVVKVFPFYAPPLTTKLAEISLAKNEVENLQLAVRATE
ncbi:MAG: carbohydrate binding domain-containing protein, partial [Opitutales bacterium]|nr:carbohydrate binding domain-containing protein [Opitutales bacterium]